MRKSTAFCHLTVLGMHVGLKCSSVFIEDRYGTSSCLVVNWPTLGFSASVARLHKSAPARPISHFVISVKRRELNLLISEIGLISVLLA